MIFVYTIVVYLYIQKNKSMKKKKNKVLLPKRFEADDIDKWKQQAQKKHNGNLSLWMAVTLNAASKKIKIIKSHE